MADTEKKGLGIPATRAVIIKKLVTFGFAERKNKQLLPTKKDVDLIAVLPEEVKSPKMTAEWENALTLIAKGACPEGLYEENDRMEIRGDCKKVIAQGNWHKEQDRPKDSEKVRPQRT